MAQRELSREQMPRSGTAASEQAGISLLQEGEQVNAPPE